MNLGKAIRDIRKEKKISQSVLAEKTGISQTSLSQIETGVKRPSSSTIEKICSALKVAEPFIYLMAIEEKDIPEERRGLFEGLYPVLRGIIMQIT